MRNQLQSVFSRHAIFDETVWRELEDVLIRADVGVEATVTLVETLKSLAVTGKIAEPTALLPALKEELTAILTSENCRKASPPKSPGLTVYLMAGVNGTGKTTTIAKLAYLTKKKGEKVLLAAADTFRAAAIEQLEEWGKRLGVDVIKHQRGADASAVVFDAVQAARSRNVKALFVDTAGRLHTYDHLMEELKKIKRIAVREAGEEAVITWLVVDAGTGQNAISQARRFDEAIGVDGIILSKLDGTAKGGIVVAVKAELGIPVRYVGIGEKMTDLQEFSPTDFVRALLSE